MAKREYPSIDLVRECLREEDGRLYWLKRPRHHFKREPDWRTWNSSWSGKEAGSPSGEKGKRRWRVVLNRFGIYRYQIVWAFHKDEWRSLLDHENRNQLDDRIENLRSVTHSLNHANRPINKNNRSGFKGVSWHSQAGRWAARVMVNRKNVYLGLFDDPAEAHQAYLKAAQHHFGEFACSG